MRGWAGWVASAGALLLLMGCTAGSQSRAPAPKKAPSSTAGHRPAVVATERTAGSALIDSQTLPCGNAIGDQSPPRDWQVVLGVVALPASPAAAALQTGLTGEAVPALRLFAKSGLVIKAGVTFALIAPSLNDNRVAIGWAGNPSTPSRRVLVASCADAGGTGWLAYPGGYWLDHPACIRMTIRSGTGKQQVAIGLGTPCPGQRPPQGPSDR